MKGFRAECPTCAAWAAAAAPWGVTPCACPGQEGYRWRRGEGLSALVVVADGGDVPAGTVLAHVAQRTDGRWQAFLCVPVAGFGDKGERVGPWPTRAAAAVALGAAIGLDWSAPRRSPPGQCGLPGIARDSPSLSVRRGRGAELHRRRVAAGLTLRELARRVGVSAATLSRYERGVWPVPDDRWLACHRATCQPDPYEEVPADAD